MTKIYENSEGTTKCSAYIFLIFRKNIVLLYLGINKKMLAALKNVQSCNMHINKNKIKIAEKLQILNTKTWHREIPHVFANIKRRRGIRKIQRNIFNSEDHFTGKLKTSLLSGHRPVTAVHAGEQCITES